MGSPSCPAKAMYSSKVRSWSRKKTTRCSSHAARSSAISALEGFFRLTPSISAPKAPAMRRTFMRRKAASWRFLHRGEQSHVEPVRAVVGARAEKRDSLRLPNRAPAHDREAPGRAARALRPRAPARALERGAELDERRRQLARR